MDYHRSVCACSIDSVSTTYNANTVTLLSNLSYRPFGIAKGMDNGSGGTVDNVFDQSGRLTIANPGADKEQTYTYDDIGNLTSVTSPNVAWYNRVFGYDALNRLDHAEGPWGVIDFTYDGVGNRLTKTANNQTTIYTYTPGTNRLQETTGPVAYTYDANGNITGIGSKVLTYNQNNRLIRVEENSNILGEYTYNGLGQRVVKTANNVTTIFHYDFNGHLIAESDQDGNFTYEYLYKGSTRLALVDVISGEIFSFLNDRLGTPLMLTDSTNTVVWEGIYKPFGEAEVNPNSSVVNNFRFPGQYYDEETGLHYNWHRYYDPQTGRYLTPDPIGLVGGDFNLYLYADNNPVNWFDPFGLYKRIEFSEPHPGGDPIAQWEQVRTEGKLSAMLKWWTLTMVKDYLKIPIPIPMEFFKYTEHHTIFQRLYLYVDFYEVEYDDCTNKERNRTPLPSGKINRTVDVIVDEWTEVKRLGR